MSRAKLDISRKVARSKKPVLHAHQVCGGYLRIEACSAHVPAPRARSASAALRVYKIGYFQPDKGQSGCVSCDIILGDSYQELSAQSSCVACPANTVRFIGVLTAATRSACRCKEGDVSVERAL